MKEEFDSYLKTLGMTAPLLTRVESILSFYQTILKKAVSDIYVSEYVNQENVRTFESVYLFGPDWLGEAKSFVNEDDFDFVIIPKPPSYWQLKKKDFEPGKSDEKSRMFLDVKLTGTGGFSSIGAAFKASATNCDKLFAIFTKYFCQQ
jgi:hypothetical protein